MLEGDLLDRRRRVMTREGQVVENKVSEFPVLICVYDYTLFRTERSVGTLQCDVECPHVFIVRIVEEVYKLS